MTILELFSLSRRSLIKSVAFSYRVVKVLPCGSVHRVSCWLAYIHSHSGRLEV